MEDHHALTRGCESRGNHSVSWFAVRAVFLSCLCMLVTGCIHWPDVAYDCASYGVAENHDALGIDLQLEPLYHDELQEICGSAAGAAAMIVEDVEIRGCVIPEKDGSIHGYYAVGDRCAMYHEICHAKHGVNHTHQYEEDLKNRVPMPYCPRNQIKLFTRS